MARTFAAGRLPPAVGRSSQTRLTLVYVVLYLGYGAR
jgi:hypothetical protein